MPKLYYKLKSKTRVNFKQVSVIPKLATTNVVHICVLGGVAVVKEVRRKREKKKKKEREKRKRKTRIICRVASLFTKKRR